MFKSIVRRIRSYSNLIKANFQAQRWALNNINKSLPIYTKTMPSGIKLHLGAGPVNIQGWINIDARSYAHTHIVSEGFGLNEFADNSIAEIYMCHVLEHFSFSEAENILKRFRTKLRSGGILRISVPSFDELVKVYVDNQFDISSIQLALMGGQDYEHNFHRSVYTERSLTILLTRCGFQAIQRWDTAEEFGIDLGDWSSRLVKTPVSSRLISLNLSAKRFDQEDREA
jgi:predicted SAM-dependent methyltransferase